MIDRDMQKNILEFLYSIYPDFAQPFKIPQNKDENFLFNLFYLQGHGLIEGQPSAECGPRDFLHVTITPRGIDFLADDGGLSAVLGVVTIKIHTDFIIALIEAHLINTPIPIEEKSIILDAVRKAPATLLTETLKKLAGLALSQAPHGYQLLKSIFLG